MDKRLRTDERQREAVREMKKALKKLRKNDLRLVFDAEYYYFGLLNIRPLKKKEGEEREGLYKEETEAVGTREENRVHVLRNLIPLPQDNLHQVYPNEYAEIRKKNNPKGRMTHRCAKLRRC